MSMCQQNLQALKRDLICYTEMPRHDKVDALMPESEQVRVGLFKAESETTISGVSPEVE